jgi:hypothetical protein
MREKLAVLFLLFFLGFLPAQTLRGAENCATLAGKSPPVAGSSGTLILPDLTAKKFRWRSTDPIFGTVDTGVVNATRWTIAGSNPIQVVFVGTGGGVTINGNAILSPYNRAVVDLTDGSKRIRYLVVLPEVKITNVVFDHKEPEKNDTDGLKIRKDLANHLAHSLDKKGEWIKGARNEPALYVAQKNVTVKARFTADPLLTTADIFATAKTGLLPNVKSTTVNFTGGVSNPEFVEFSLERATDDKINKVSETWEWKLGNERCGGAEIKFDESGPHTVYTVLAVPSLPWYREEPAGTIKKDHEPWVSALDFVIETAGTKGKKTVPEAVSQITSFLHGAFGLKYDAKEGRPKYAVGDNNRTTVTYNLTAFFTKANMDVVNCYDLAGSLATLANLIGANSEYRYLGKYSGAAASTKTFGYINETSLIGHGNSNNPFFMASYVTSAKVVGVNDCVEDVIPAGMPDAGKRKRSYFGNHAFVTLAGKVYDANVKPFLGADDIAGYVAAGIDSIDSAGRTCNKDKAGDAAQVQAAATIKLK